MSKHVPRLSEARTPGEILTASAAFARYERDGGSSATLDVPSDFDLAQWSLHESPSEGMEANRSLNAVLKGGSWEWGMLSPHQPIVDDMPLCAVSHLADLVSDDGTSEMVAIQALPFELVHANWCSHGKPSRPVHPVVPLVRAWQRRPRVGKDFRPRERASLARLHLITADQVQRLPNFDQSPQDGNQLQPHLPGLSAVEGYACPSWLLSLYDRAGGRVLSQGKGAPWDLRLMIAALLHLHIDERDGFTRTRSFSAKYVESWLHPDGWRNRSRDWHLFPEALARIDSLSRLYIPGHGRFGLVWASGIPAFHMDRTVEFHLRIPGRAAAGARLSWPRLCRYGAESAVLYRAYLAAVAYLDRSSVDGHPITVEIGAPVLDAHGEPIRLQGKGGKPGPMVRDHGSLSENPASRYVGVLDGYDLARMVGLDPSNRVYRFKARRAFERLNLDGVIDLRETGSGLRIFGRLAQSDTVDETSY